MRILLVEGDIGLAKVVRAYLRLQAFQVDFVPGVSAAIAAMQGEHYSAILLDLDLAGGEGAALLPELASLPHRPAIMVLTARNGIDEKISCLENGADDYLVKPYDPEELLARLRAVERRRTRKFTVSLVMLATIEIDLDRSEVRRQGIGINLTRMEWDLLRFMAHRPDSIHSREDLADALYRDAPESASNTLEVFVSRLRRKIGRENIQTLRGRGYRLAHQVAQRGGQPGQEKCTATGGPGGGSQHQNHRTEA